MTKTCLHACFPVCRYVVLCSVSHGLMVQECLSVKPVNVLSTAGVWTPRRQQVAIVSSRTDIPSSNNCSPQPPLSGRSGRNRRAEGRSNDGKFADNKGPVGTLPPHTAIPPLTPPPPPTQCNSYANMWLIQSALERS